MSYENLTRNQQELIKWMVQVSKSSGVNEFQAEKDDSEFIPKIILHASNGNKCRVDKTMIDNLVSENLLWLIEVPNEYYSVKLLPLAFEALQNDFVKVKVGDYDDIKIGIVTALPIEFASMKPLLENPKKIPIETRSNRIPQQYTIGEIPSGNKKSHRVVLTRTSDMGNNSAATRATLLQEHFRNLQYIIMVGIAGGIPYPEKPSEHVRLGDIVVSGLYGVVQYDFAKEETNRVTIRSRPRPPSADLLQIVYDLKAGEMMGKFPWIKFIDQLVSSYDWAKRPGMSKDILKSTTDPNTKLKHPNDSQRRGNQPRVFIGPIASSNTLQKNPVKRDALRDSFAVKAVEMEGSGIADGTWESGIEYLVIRGICDYCDSEKNDEWHGYAAVVAAAYTRSLLEAISI